MLFQLIFSVMPMFVSLFWAVMLVKDGAKNLPKRYLAFFLSLSVINYFTHAAFFNHQYALFGFMDNIWVFTSLSGYPLYYYYIRLLTSDVKINWKWSWIILPSVLLSAFSFIVYFLMSPQKINMFIHNIMYHEGVLEKPYPLLVQLQVLRTLLFKFIFFVQVILSLYFGYRLIVRYNKNVREYYSNIGGKDLSPIKWVFIAFIFASIISLASSVIGKDFFVDRGIMLIIPSITHSLFLFFIGYVGYHQNFTITDFTNDINRYNEQELVDDKENMAISKGKASKEQLDSLLKDEGLFKNPELRITDIAHILGTNRTYVSRIVNEEMQTNFCDWVNSYRIDFAKQIISDRTHAHLSLQEISEMSGFSSLSVFYRVFKEKAGVSPGKYKEDMQSDFT